MVRNFTLWPGINHAYYLDIKSHVEVIMHTCRPRLLLRIPKHPTIAGYFWVTYFVALGLLIFD